MDTEIGVGYECWPLGLVQRQQNLNEFVRICKVLRQETVQIANENADVEHLAGDFVALSVALEAFLNPMRKFELCNYAPWAANGVRAIDLLQAKRADDGDVDCFSDSSSACAPKVNLDPELKRSRSKRPKLSSAVKPRTRLQPSGRGRPRGRPKRKRIPSRRLRHLSDDESCASSHQVQECHEPPNAPQVRRFDSPKKEKSPQAKSAVSADSTAVDRRPIGKGKKLGNTVDVCQVCFVVTESPYKLIKHMRGEHVTSAGCFRCDVCGFETKYYLPWARHMAFQCAVEEWAQCAVCAKGMLRCNLPEHVQIHYPQLYPRHRNIRCSLCSFTTHKRSLLNRHMGTHQQSKTFSCPYKGCDATFKLRLYLRRHIKIVHLKVGRSVCDHCGKTFGTTARMKRHLLTHTGERPHVCKICQHGFSQRSNLRVHVRMVHKKTLEEVLAAENSQVPGNQARPRRTPKTISANHTTAKTGQLTREIACSSNQSDGHGHRNVSNNRKDSSNSSPRNLKNSSFIPVRLGAASLCLPSSEVELDLEFQPFLAQALLRQNVQ